jgi:hypothetical protein
LEGRFASGELTLPPLKGEGVHILRFGNLNNKKQEKEHQL